MSSSEASSLEGHVVNPAVRPADFCHGLLVHDIASLHGWSEYPSSALRLSNRQDHLRVLPCDLKAQRHTVRVFEGGTLIPEPLDSRPVRTGIMRTLHQAVGELHSMPGHLLVVVFCQSAVVFCQPQEKL